MKQFGLNIPINGVSFGQVSYAILKEMLDRGIEPNLFSIGNPDLKSQNVSSEDHEKIVRLLKDSLHKHSKKDPCFKLWHLNGSLESFSEKQLPLTFHELDTATKEEINAAKNNKIQSDLNMCVGMSSICELGTRGRSCSNTNCSAECICGK